METYYLNNKKKMFKEVRGVSKSPISKPKSK